ncbi:MAG TPA: hypothetical protein VFJ07_02880 [Streptosporangiaceae bacterium]|nr:hypothetical protein [Streptosporangiaceae bacterium]
MGGGGGTAVFLSQKTFAVLFSAPGMHTSASPDTPGKTLPPAIPVTVP